MPKKEYLTPALEVIAVDAPDVITSSTDPFDGVWVPIGGTKSNTVDSSLYNLN